MARPYWSGQITISLVSFSVKLFVATEAKSQITFHQISRSTGERVRHQKVLASAQEAHEQAPGEDTPAAAVVEKDEIVKGYEYRKGEYVTIEPSELASLRIPSKHTMEVSQFVDRDDIDPEYFEKPYFVVPENESQTQAFAVVRQALQETKKIALAKIAFAGREHIVAITPSPDESLPGMMAYIMRYQEELRDPGEYFRDIKKVEVEADSLSLAKELIKRKAAKFDPAGFVDGYEIALKELVEAKVNNAPIPKDELPAPQRAKVISLMDALRRSVSSVNVQTPAERLAQREDKHAKTAAKGIELVHPKKPVKSAGAKSGAKAEKKTRIKSA
jgi:DNA end-binding protein Ku